MDALDKFYAPIPDTDAYLARLGCSAPTALGLDALAQLIYAHQRAVCFENLTPWAYRQAVSLGAAELFEKIVINGRGGFCFELNGLFCALLRALGYDASECFARVLPPDGSRPRIMHASILVTLDGKRYFCDVGFGGPAPSGPVPVEDGGSFTRGGETHSVFRVSGPWYQLERRTSSGEAQPLLQFLPIPQEPQDFEAFALYSSLSPESVFTQIPMLNRRTERGCVTIHGRELTVTENGRAERRELDDAALKSAIKQYFELELP